MNDNELIWESYTGGDSNNNTNNSIVPVSDKKNYEISAKIASEVVKRSKKRYIGGLEWLESLIDVGGANIEEFFHWLETRDAIDVKPSDSTKQLK